MINLKIINRITLQLLFLSVTIGCKEVSQEKTSESSIHPESSFFDLQVGRVKIKTEVAALPQEREMGLMFRDSLQAKRGMFFIFKEPSKRRFWMKNTWIPLDIGYFTQAGTLVEIHKAQPFDQTGVPSQSNDIKFVLEMNQGAFRALGIRIGDRIVLKEVTHMLLARGLNPESYGFVEK